jgi:molybdopterin-guanine dinucleotide biosynthesis protein A
MKFAGVILAGGQATRMGGGDKSLKALGDQTMLDHVIARLAPQVEEMALNANGDPTRFAAFGLPVVCDSVDAASGPLAGILAAMDWAAGRGHEFVVTVAADTPFFPADLVTGLWLGATCKTNRIAIAASPDERKGTARQPTFGLWPTKYRDDLRQALAEGVRKVVVWADRHDPSEVVFYPDAFDPFFNVNTPADIVQAVGILKELTQ